MNQAAIKPQRIQLSRRKGFNLQRESMALNGLPAVKCARPGKWGNRFKVGCHYRKGDSNPRARLQFTYMQAYEWEPGYTTIQTPAEAVDWYRWYMKIGKQDFSEIRGRNLACFCALNKPCHCDVLLELANA